MFLAVWLAFASAFAADDPPKLSAALGKGLTVTSADERFSIGLRTRLVPRIDVAVSRDGDLQTRATISTARLWVQGHAFTKDLTYTTQLAYAARDYRDGTISPVFDAFVDWKATRDLGVKFGQYFVPFDRLRTVREFALQMTDRPRPVGEMTLDRDVGITLYSDHFLGDDSPVAYRVGVFGGEGINATDLGDAGGLFVGRLELRPLGPVDDDFEGDLERRDQPGLALGLGAAYNLNTQRIKSTTGGRFTGGSADYLHLAADAVFKWKGLAVQGEYLYRDARQDTIVSATDDGTEVTEWTRSGHGWIAQTSYTLVPGYEIVGRFSQLSANADTDPKFLADVESKGNEVGAGFNRYLNGHRFKLQASWVALFGEDGFGAADHVVSTQLDAMF